MRLLNRFNLFIIFIFLTNSFLLGQETEQLKRQDISKIMEQIFAEHLGQKTIDKKILKNAFKNYIDQFDPDRTYLTQAEVEPFLGLTSEQMEIYITAYKNEDFSSFEKLNAIIQRSILRARQYRQELIINTEELFKAADERRSSHKNTDGLEPNLKGSFASTFEQIKRRIKEQMVAFIQAEQKRYGKAQVSNYKSKLLIMFDQALKNIEEGYLYQTSEGKSYSEGKKENALVLHILKALASSLDAHTAFYSDAEAYDMKVRLEKEFDGIGVVLRSTPQGIMISSLIEGGAASKSGKIFANDYLLQINDKTTSGQTLPEVMNTIRASKEPSIELVISRSFQEENGKQMEKQETIILKKESIPIKGERIDIKQEKVGNGIIGIITLHSFYQGEDGTGSDSDMQKALKELDRKGNLRGLILDLRENSGGFLSQAVKVAGLFISNGIVVISKYSDGEKRIYRDIDVRTAYQGPLIILTSKATASAAEIVAQALQDYGVGLIVGDEHTYGKGTIQSQTVTGNEGETTSFFKVTVGKYYTVSGKTPQLEGVKADIVVPGPYHNEPIGEEYLEHPWKPDFIKADFEDSLQDLEPSVKSWYMKYYTPTLQAKVSMWREMLPYLKKNSAYRIENNKNYQMFLKQKKEGNGDDIRLSGSSIEDEPGKESNNYGKEDLQMQETINVLKDMIYLHSKKRQNQEVKGATASLQAATAN
ncbi:S41 family peptidase [Neochlamydia sp. AcF95]|uniref:tail-specific protease Tsp n=1 Tax=Neochlamydia sp. AcF95 TaxID=2795734 RepID=UPI001BC93BD0|nr:S41 family peptidase [Neochlamydia sp. AcF95]MBS4170707.1 Uncharacterized protein [Neochlamydia sp. AcF95]